MIRNENVSNNATELLWPVQISLFETIGNNLGIGIQAIVCFAAVVLLPISIRFFNLPLGIVLVWYWLLSLASIYHYHKERTGQKKRYKMSELLEKESSLVAVGSPQGSQLLPALNNVAKVASQHLPLKVLTFNTYSLPYNFLPDRLCRSVDARLPLFAKKYVSKFSMLILQEVFKGHFQQGRVNTFIESLRKDHGLNVVLTSPPGAQFMNIELSLF